MKILLIHPEYPDTFWSFKYALKFISKKATYPPLGLLTVASLLPQHWEKKLIDMTVASLNDNDIKWADYVFIGAMSIQKQSALRIINRCKKLKAKIVAGGPLFTSGYEDFKNVDHFILNEAEITLPDFLKDLEKDCLKQVYTSKKWADLTKTPIPFWKIADMNQYASMCLQFSRGCPFNCDFCDVTLLFGHRMRLKTGKQFIAELEDLYQKRWRAGIFIVDDNFIGNKKALKEDLLPLMIDWTKKRNFPFSFSTQVSVNLSDDEELMNLMALAGFSSVFVGIETPSQESLLECQKWQNVNRDLIACVKKMQKFGLEVSGGFIMGFDSDTPLIFERLIEFIQKSGIVSAMVGLLNAPRGTKLYQRLAKENRLLKESTGNNTDLSINFIPKMNYKTLISGYKKVLSTIYSPKYYYKRILTLMENFKPLETKRYQFHLVYLHAFFKSVWHLGILGSERFYYWKLLFWSLIRNPRLFPMVIIYAIRGYHFREIFKDY